MLFAHGPLGFLTTWLTTPWWKKYKFDQRFKYILLFIGIIGGIFPDIDHLMFYVVDATVSHREYITHTPFLYLLVLVFGISMTRVLKRPQWMFGITVFALGALSHVLTDMVVAEVRILYPFSNQFYGISNLGIERLTQNLTYVNFLLEAVILFFFGFVLLRLFFKQGVLRVALLAVLSLFFIGGVFGISVANQHIYHGPAHMTYGDFDHDGIVNYRDADIDGDGEPNLLDLDADNDQKGNVQEVSENAELFLNVWYDRSEGGFIQIPSRLGFVSNNDLVYRLFESAGIYIGQEMQLEYEQNPNGYVLPPSDEFFDRHYVNIRTWLEHTGRLESKEQLDDGRSLIGDILFFESEHVAVVTGFSTTGEPVVLDIHKNRSIHERSLAEVIDYEGTVVARGTMLDPSPLFAQ